MSLQALHAARWRIALMLTTTVVVIYFGFILLIAFNRPLMGRLITRGLTVGILLGVVVIVASWFTTWFYVRWCNTHYDEQLEAFRDSKAAGGKGA